MTFSGFICIFARLIKGFLMIEFIICSTKISEIFNNPADSMKKKMITLLLMAVVTLPSMALAQNASPTQYSVKIEKKANPDIPEGYALVTLTTHDIWKTYDGTGYQMLLDINHNTYGEIIPKKGNLTENGNASADVYAEFEYKIPENADGDLYTEDVLKDGSITIQIPAGVYDWCITNPTPSGSFAKIYIASEYGNVGGRADDYLFSGGLEYVFDVTLGDNGYDQTDLSIGGLDLTYNIDNDNITYNSADVDWEVEGPFERYSIILRYRKVNEKLVYESAEAFEALEKWDADEDNHNWQYEKTGDAHSGEGVWASYSFDEGKYEPFDPDNWLLMPTMDLKGKHLSFFARSKKKEFKDNFGVFFLPDGEERIPENLEELGAYTDIPNEWTEYTIDLSSLGEGQIVFRHFDSRDRWALYIDDVTIFDQNAVVHPEQYNWVHMTHVQEHPHLIFGLESGTKYEMQMRAEPAGWGESLFFTTADPLVLEDNADNSTVLNANPDYTGYVKLNGRTLYKDGSWNTLCLPFDVTDRNEDDDFTFTGSPLVGATVMELDTYGVNGFDPTDGTLYLTFKTAETIKAGAPYLVKWEKDADYDIIPSAFDVVNPVFEGVTFSSTAAQTVVSETDDLKTVQMIGTFSPFDVTANDKSILYLGKDNKLYYPSVDLQIGSCRAYFSVPYIKNAGAQARAFVLNFDEEETGFETISIPSIPSTPSNLYFSLDGRSLGSKPAAPGLYIHNGRKVLIK